MISDPEIMERNVRALHLNEIDNLLCKHYVINRHLYQDE